MERNPYLIEVVASTVHSCIEAEQGGAGRIELCSALGAAGITPSSGLLEVVKRHIQIPVYAMIRPREGDFTYSASEIEVMKREIDLLGASGADGFVFGILKSDGTIDTAVTRQLVDQETILAMVEAAGGAIRIMPGGGIKPETFDKMYHPSINEYHLSGRMQHRSTMASTLFDMDWAETTRENIAHVVYRP